MHQKTPKTNRFVITIVEPTGVESKIEPTIPKPEQHTEMMAEQMITFLKLLNTLMDESAGKIISAEISKVPTSFIASTMIMAVMIAISMLYAFAFTPLASAKFSSKVTAKILL